MQEHHKKHCSAELVGLKNGKIYTPLTTEFIYAINFLHVSSACGNGTFTSIQNKTLFKVSCWANPPDVRSLLEFVQKMDKKRHVCVCSLSRFGLNAALRIYFPYTGFYWIREMIRGSKDESQPGGPYQIRLVIPQPVQAHFSFANQCLPALFFSSRVGDLIIRGFSLLLGCLGDVMRKTGGCRDQIAILRRQHSWNVARSHGLYFLGGLRAHFQYGNPGMQTAVSICFIMSSSYWYLLFSLFEKYCFIKMY